MRDWRDGDLDGIRELLRRSEVMRYLSGEPHARNDAWRSMAVAAGHWVLRGYGMWVVERKSDGAVVGRVGLINPEGWPGLEVGWTLGRALLGPGLRHRSRPRSDELWLPDARRRQAHLADRLRQQASQAVARRLGETRAGIRAGHRRAKLHRHIWSITPRGMAQARGSAMSDAPAVYRDRDFNVFLASRFFSTIAMQIQSVAVGWQVYEIARTPLALGLVGLAEFVPMFLLTLPAGDISDRFDQRKVLAVEPDRAKRLCGALLVALTFGHCTSACRSIW